MNSLTLSFYGINIQFTSHAQRIVEDIERDYSFFKNEAVGNPKISINAYNTRPPYDILPPMQASYTSPRNICYYYKGIKYIDYLGNALVIYNKAKSLCEIYSSDYPLLQEICYTAILSLVSEKLDERHMHRVHGLGLSVDDKAILILLDMGGGKTTLAMNLLMSDNDIKLISEDSPLINTKGQILPFPLRIGLDPEDVPPEIPKEYQRYFERQEFGPKILIDIEYFRNKICKHPCQPHVVIIGRRVLGRQPEIKPCSKYQSILEFIKNSVIGLGLYQGIEYLFQKGPKEIITKIPVGISRLNNALKVMNRSKIYELYLSPNREQNNQVLIEFLKKEIQNDR